ncbi:glycosyltransferase [Pelolinea submarina]|nr:glycosyltransferase [Pelolinea submarina]
MEELIMKFAEEFKKSTRAHILMITNHGMHHWNIIPGLPDTGGQNVFVNEFSDALANQGYRITIINRGGYANPVSGEMRKGILYKDENQRIMYLEDGRGEFISKEDMDAQMPALLENLKQQLKEEGSKVDVIISHYWDGAKLGILYNQTLSKKKTHIWVPHSLGDVKKRNINSTEWDKLRIDNRIDNEISIIQEVDQIASTSSIIEQSLKNDYGFTGKMLFLPPCVNSERYCPHKIADDHPVWEFLEHHGQMKAEEIRTSRIITEISRTDSTKRKDVLIKAFTQVQQEFKNTVLVLTIDRQNSQLYEKLQHLIHASGIQDHVIVLGSVWDELPDIYAITDIYCTPSVMEGFGMTSQEAAATRVPVISSDLVPFVTEYLLGDNVKALIVNGDETQVKKGTGALVVPADDIDGFAMALKWLLSNEEIRKEMGEAAYKITIPYFTWKNIVNAFLTESGVNAYPERND